LREVVPPSWAPIACVDDTMTDRRMEEQMSDSRTPGPNDRSATTSTPEIHAAFPSNAVVGIVGDPRELSHVVEELRATGHCPDLLCGARGTERIEQAGGSTAEVQVIRSVQKLFGFEADHAERHQRALDDGEFVVIVGASDNAEADRVGQAFAAHGGRFVNHYTRWTGRRLIP
jgi:hypothetical protein